MCSVDEDSSIECCTEARRDTDSLLHALCKKCCENKADVVLRGKDAYCGNCFLAGATHKFRAALGKTKIMKPGDRVLVGFSGSQASAALLHLIKQGLSESTHKRLLFVPSVLYIDESAVLGISEEDRTQNMSEMINMILDTGIPGYVTRLEKIFQVGNDNLYSQVEMHTECEVNTHHEEKLKQLFSSVSTLTSKEELLLRLRHMLLVRIADQLQCPKVFVADSGTDLAVKILTNVAVGKGAHLPLDVGFFDTRNCNVMILRPMRDFLKKEIAFYNVMNGIKSISIPSLGTKAKPYDSIHKLTEKFITELQDGFPSTIHTVFRVGDKMSLGSAIDEENVQSCAMCKAPVDTVGKRELSSLQSTAFSHVVSALGPEKYEALIKTNALVQEGNESKPEQRKTCSENRESSCEKDSLNFVTCCSTSACNNCDCSHSMVPDRTFHISKEEAVEFMCYSCRLLLKDMDHIENLPRDILQVLHQCKKLKQMRNEIEDFLL